MPIRTFQNPSQSVIDGWEKAHTTLRIAGAWRINSLTNTLRCYGRSMTTVQADPNDDAGQPSDEALSDDRETLADILSTPDAADIAIDFTRRISYPRPAVFD